MVSVSSRFIRILKSDKGRPQMKLQEFGEKINFNVRLLNQLKAEIGYHLWDDLCPQLRDQLEIQLIDQLNEDLR